jgi:dienelactone hydrolase
LDDAGVHLQADKGAVVMAKFVTAACLVLLIGMLRLISIAHAEFGERVQFESAPLQPSEFQKQKAKESGKTLAVPPGLPLEGYLVTPEGLGPFPAVVMLHGCDGIHEGAEGAWSRRLVSWGYVVLIVDSLKTRGFQEICTKFVSGLSYDAYGALEYLSGLPIVVPERVVLMGFSRGGATALVALEQGAVSVEAIMERKFKAAVAFYPRCSDSTGDMSVPTLILIGELDDWTPAEDCRRMMSDRSGEGASVELVVYPGAHHAFVSTEIQPGMTVFGNHWIQYNEAAAGRSVDDVRAFLQRTVHN